AARCLWRLSANRSSQSSIDRTALSWRTADQRSAARLSQRHGLGTRRSSRALRQGRQVPYGWSRSWRSRRVAAVAVGRLTARNQDSTLANVLGAGGAGYNAHFGRLPGRNTWRV